MSSSGTRGTSTWLFDGPISVTIENIEYSLYVNLYIKNTDLVTVKEINPSRIDKLIGRKRVIDEYEKSMDNLPENIQREIRSKYHELISAS